MGTIFLFLGIYTLVSLLIGYLVALIWLIKSKDRRLVRRFSGLFYLPISVFTTSIFLMSTSEILNKFVFKVASSDFDINSFLKGFGEFTVVFGFPSGITTIIVFLLGDFIRRE